jgi:hypothetical protein
MYARMQEVGVNAPIALRAVEPERVTLAVLDAIANDRPDALVTAWPMRPRLSLQELALRLAERIVTRHWREQVLRAVGRANQPQRTLAASRPPGPHANSPRSPVQN